MNEALKGSATELLSELMKVVEEDDEDNAATALKIVVELHKAYKTHLEDQVVPFFDMVQKMYRNMDQAVENNFDNPDVGFIRRRVSQGCGANVGLPHFFTQEDVDVPVMSQRPGEEEGSYNLPLAPSLLSFKVLKECPIILVLLLQIHRKFVNETVENLVPLIINVLGLQPKLQIEAHKEAAANGEEFVGVSPAIKNRAAYAEFKAMQVKVRLRAAMCCSAFVSF